MNLKSGKIMHNTKVDESRTDPFLLLIPTADFANGKDIFHGCYHVIYGQINNRTKTGYGH
jgi:hypothetical protein